MIFRIQKRPPGYVQIQNSIFEDSNLDMPTLGLLSYLLSKPDQWEVRREQLAKRFGVHPNTITTRLRALREAGYAQISHSRNESGQISGSSYDIFEEPDSQHTVTRPTHKIPEPRSDCEPSNTEGSTTSNGSANPKPPAKEKRTEKSNTRERARKKTPESLEDVREYATEIDLSSLEAEKFWNHFESNGWRVGGRAPMKDWRAALRNWKSRQTEFIPNGLQRATRTGDIDYGAGW